MFLSQLFEAIDNQHAAFCFGRMNPPTVGHNQVINAVIQQGKGNNFYIFTSQSQDSKKNPLDYKTKINFLRALYPSIANNIIYDTNLKTIMQVASWLYNKGYKSVTFVAGEDRLDDFKELLNKYNGVQTQTGFYKFDRINLVSSGDRDPDAEGVAGVSASSAREAARSGNYNEFAQTVGAGKLTKDLYSAVRKGLLVEDASGYIPKNKKEAKDPRWSNALTVDVTPDTPRKNMKAMGLI